MTSEAADAAADVRLSEVTLGHAADGHTLVFRGPLVLDEAAALWTDLRKATATLPRGERISFDLEAAATIDGGTMALLVHVARALSARGVKASFVGADHNARTLLALYQGSTRPRRAPRRAGEGLLAEVGRRTLLGVRELRQMLDFLGQSALAILGLVRAPRTGNSRDLVPLMERMGVDAVPIVVLINFLVGFVLAYQSAGQLRQFGANIYVANLVGLSLTREMGPLMTAIILCGRSGAAYAAELGSMKVGEELDALRSMGFGPIRYLVVPRVLALVLVAPLLTIVADVVGLLGGLVVGVTSLDLSPRLYFHQTQHALALWDVTAGLVKSVVFALAIGLIACQQGFATTGGAEGVGRRTTSAVVITLLMLIVIDAVFTVFFRVFGL
jgi:phospholipid/cholesterol/gamma-HCH transport system permease protein